MRSPLVYGSASFLLAGFSAAMLGPRLAAAAEELALHAVEMPVGIPRNLWLSRVDPSQLRAKKVSLGEDLFRDTLLSADDSVSCATCHDPSNAYADNNAVAIGIAKQSGQRNSPSLFNVCFSTSQFWDGRATTLEEQAAGPLENPLEMGKQTVSEVAARVNDSPRYRKRFSVVYGAVGVTDKTLIDAIVSFERTLLSGDSAFDRYQAGDSAAISQAAKRGWEIFSGKANCIACHSYERASPFFTDSGFHNTGVAAKSGQFPAASHISASELKRLRSEGKDLGRFNVTGNISDLAAYRTPSLRNAALTGPYMHDGSFASLAAVVNFYAAGAIRDGYVSEKLKPVALSQSERTDLVAFLESLSGDGAVAKRNAGAGAGAGAK